MLFGPGSVGRQMVAGNAAGNIIAGASLNLNFMNAGMLPSGVVFTRASTATYFDSTGTMQTAAMNLMLQSGSCPMAAPVDQRWSLVRLLQHRQRTLRSRQEWHSDSDTSGLSRRAFWCKCHWRMVPVE